MSDELPANKEHTYVFDPESATEMARLIDQGRMITKCMGGVLAEQPHPEQFQTILDVACGPGDWVLDVAFAYPQSTVCGIDISRTMVDYANARVRSQHLSNASFGVMDIRQPLDFSDASFDLVNARLLVAVLRREDWPRLIDECKRVLKPGGVLRLTETDHFGVSTCPAHDRIVELIIQVLNRTGHGFSPDGRSTGITPALPLLLRRAGFVEIGSSAHVLRFSPFDETYADMRNNARIVTLQLRTPMTKLGLVTEQEFDRLYQQMELELLSDDFSGVWPFLTVWGRKPY
ncbi:MAG TPA: methyltransferase domain-containing protein [Ktedonobacteraceae bacterium]|nr:methyltransferase domain-containing protein [Ktedonobacteraceae bacterium]